MKDSEKTHPRISSKEIADALGADSVVGSITKDDQGREFFEVIVTSEHPEFKRIYKLSEEELDKYRSIGEVEGQNFIHCLFLSRHTDNFYNRVWGYRILEPTQSGMALRVLFYEKI